MYVPKVLYARRDNLFYMATTATHTASPPDTDRQFMRRALELAAQGRGTASPNPMVGCVIVRNGQIIGEGFHARAGIF